MKEPADKEGFRDRKLGDEWADWDGRSGPQEQEIEERSATFLALFAVAVFMLIGLFAIAWYMMRPRLEQFSTSLPGTMEWVMIGLAACILALVLIEIFILRKAGKSLLPYKWVASLVLLALPKALWVGGRLGISRDRVGNSFIKVHNYIITTHAERVNPARLLMLLPRCLGKEARGEVISRTDQYDMYVVTVGGGEEARKAIGQYHPSLVLAVACERDLLSGIRDITVKVPVLAIPNTRPEGPCKNTCLQIDKFEEMLRFVKARKKQAGPHPVP